MANIYRPKLRELTSRCLAAEQEDKERERALRMQLQHTIQCMLNNFNIEPISSSNKDSEANG